MIDFIKSRRSIRSFTNQKVNEQDLNQIVECGLCAPSGMNRQGISFCVITSETILNELEGIANREFFYHAPALIVVYCDSDYKYAYTDGSLCMGQMYLAAHALGLGSCWINQIKEPMFEETLTKIGLSNKIIVGSLAVGYPNETPKPRDIKENRVKYIK